MLVNLSALKRQLRLDLESTEDDPLLADHLAVAQDVVLRYVARPDDEAWTEAIAAWTADTAPEPVRHAILMQASELWASRGDATGETRATRRLSPAIEALLAVSGMRRPVVA